MKNKGELRKKYSIKKFYTTNSLYDLNQIIMLNEKRIKRQSKNFLTKELQEKISYLIREHDNNEEIAGTIEIFGILSKEYALEIINKNEDILIDKILSAKETGDIGDIILVISDISKEKSLELLEKVTSEKIVKRMYEEDFNLHIRSVGWLLYVLNELSPNFTLEFLEKIGLERIYVLIEKHLGNSQAIERFIKYLEKVSEEFSVQIRNKFNLK